MVYTWFAFKPYNIIKLKSWDIKLFINIWIELKCENNKLALYYLYLFIYI